ncbi:hypothetical protein [Basilea psittacipulmonis]|uniref:hypothetical protein n=1 Tax=Basilea psittacipulmonis TaxID=1472345 RepID=UPI001301269E|nr:hypothetical protein [Basilea psittacipulmonis]
MKKQVIYIYGQPYIMNEHGTLSRVRKAWWQMRITKILALFIAGFITAHLI